MAASILYPHRKGPIYTILIAVIGQWLIAVLLFELAFSSSQNTFVCYCLCMYVFIKALLIDPWLLGEDILMGEINMGIPWVLVGPYAFCSLAACHMPGIWMVFRRCPPGFCLPHNPAYIQESHPCFGGWRGCGQAVRE